MKNRFSLLIISFLFIIVLSVNVFAQINQATPFGNGTVDNPYVINSIANLSWLTQHPDEWNKYYIQTSNIDASVTQFWDDSNDNSPFDSDNYDDPNDETSEGNNEGFPPIGRIGEVAFTGHYDGRGHSITNIKINRISSNYIGLFGRISDYFDGNTSISNLFVLNIEVTGNESVGGLVGQGFHGQITNCYTSGTINGQDDVVGGLVGGTNSLTISKCYSTCDVIGTGVNSIAGGLVGYLDFSTLVENCYSTGNVTGDNTVGGLIGHNNSSTVSNCYSVGTVSGIIKGGLIGAEVSGNVSNSFWDTQTSEQLTSEGGTGKTTAQMKDYFLYTDAGWDFVTETTNGTDDIWDDDHEESINNGYPILSWQSGADGSLGQLYSGGSGTSGDPYEIATIEDLIFLSQHSVHWINHFKQTSDLNFNSYETQVDWDGDGIADGLGTSGFSPIGNSTTKFTGSYNGQTYTIKDLYINRSTESYIGLFGYIWNGNIENVGVVNIEFAGASHVGGIVGNASFSSTVKNSYSSGTVIGSSSYVGGLVGTNASSTISNCYSRVTTTGEANVGGLVGFQEYSSLSNSYSTGTVTGNSYSGGLIGYENTSSITNSFWDTETSGKTNSSGGIGKTTLEMKYYKTFIDAGWDFVTETANGTNDYWDGDQERTINDGYMILSWQDGADNIYHRYSSGVGTSTDPFVISTTTDLLYLSLHSDDWSSCFIQTANILFDSNPNEVDWDQDGNPEEIINYGFSPIGNTTTYFTGSYDGQNFYISHLFINRGFEDYIGLFGYTYSGATIQKVGLSNVNITGNRIVGGLIGRALSSTISESYTTGNISGNSDYVSGLVGVNSSSTITDSYSQASVTGGDDYTGGLVGINISSSLIENCYSTGNVSGVDQYIGGLVGSNSATVTNSFWDTETSGQATSSGGTGKTTAEMKLNSTYLNAGWDTDIWNMDATLNNGYPYLNWQVPSGSPLPVELISFTAKSVGESVVLTWNTATEVNNYGFEIERASLSATPVKTWEIIGFVDGHGNSNSPNDYSYIDTEKLNGTVQYRLKQVDFDGSFEYSDIVEIEAGNKLQYKLAQNYPNPFNPTTVIEFVIPNVKSEMSNVKLVVSNILGEEVAVLINKPMVSGNHSVSFDASNLPSGIYFYSISVNGFTEVKKMNLIK